MRHASLLLRGKTPPPRRLTSSVPAGGTHTSLTAAADRMAKASKATADSAVQQRARTLTASHALISTSFASSEFPQRERAKITVNEFSQEAACELKVDFLSQPCVRGTATVRSVAASATRGVSAVRAFSAPLRTSLRCASDSAFPTHATQNHDEEVQTTFDGNEPSDFAPSTPASHSPTPSSAAVAPGNAAQRTRGGTNRALRQGSPPQQHHKNPSSAQLLDRSVNEYKGTHRSSTGSGSRSRANINKKQTSAGASSEGPGQQEHQRQLYTEEESRAMLAARLMRRHRLHAAQPYLVVSSGVEVPGCSGGAYHLQERQDARAAAHAAVGAAKVNAYAGRVRSGGSNVRMPAFFHTSQTSASSAVSSSTFANGVGKTGSTGRGAAHVSAEAVTPQVLRRDATYTRMQDYEPFERLFRRYLERGHVAHAAQRLLHHPDGPAPIIVLDRILCHRVPAPSFVSQALLATLHAARSDRSTSAAVTFAVERVAARLKNDLVCRPLYDTPELRVLLLEAAVREGLFDLTQSILHDTPATWITPHLWSLLVQTAGQSKLPHSQLLWRLLNIREGVSAGDAEEEQLERGGGVSAGASGLLPQRVLTRAGESALLRRVPLAPAFHAAAPPAPPSAPSASPPLPRTPAENSSENRDSTAVVASKPGIPASTSATRSAAPSSELPLAAAHIPGAVFEARACSTVLMPAHGSIGTPLLRSVTSAEENEEDASGRHTPDAGASAGSAQPLLLTATLETSSALVSSTFRMDGLRWCALGSVDMGYAAEHYNGDTAGSAGDFRAAGAAGVLHGFSSFQSLHAAVEAEMRVSATSATTAATSSASPAGTAGSAASSSSASSAGSSRAARRALWETTALRMVHQHHGIVYGLDATTTARVLLRCGVGFSGQASPLLAQHVLRRYLRSCHLLRDEVVRAQEVIEAQLDAEEGGLVNTKLAAATASSSAQDEGSTTIRNNSNNVENNGIQISDRSSSVDGRVEANTTTTTTTAVATLAARPTAERLLALYPRLARVAAPHPSPFLVFFKVMREAREVLSNAVDEEAAASAAPATAAATSRIRIGLRANTSLPMVHWEVVWHVFQQLNRENPQWYTQLTLQEAGDLCQDVIEVLCHGADPWLTLNIARRVSSRHIVDGVDMSLWLLHRLDPSHHTEESREVARKLFRWLLVDVGLHLQPALHHHLIPAARALIRLGLQEELRVLYSAVLDNVYLFRPEHRDAFVSVLSDLICPSCATILPDSDVYVDRACPNCMTVVPAKDAETIPSFRLSAEHVERLRARRKQQRQRSRQRLSASVQRLQSEEHGGGQWHTPQQRQQQQLLRGPQDAAEVLRRHLQRSRDDDDGAGETSDEATMALLLSGEATLIPGVPVTPDVALFPLHGAAGGESKDGLPGGSAGAPVLDVRAAMEESSRRLELQRAARRYALAQRGVLDENDRSSAAALHGLTPTPRSPAALPTTLPISAQALDAATLKYLSTAANLSAHAAANNGGGGGGAHDGAWVCVWCQEKNTEWSSRVQCAACGAETGPAAPWRHFAYADPLVGDAMTELRGRMSNCEDRPVDAIVAGYMLMVYRRTFQLRATPADYERLQRLIAMLCRLQERVLAGYAYTRLLPLTQRRLDGLLGLLAQTYGQENAAAYRALTQDDVMRPEREGVFFDAVFGPQTCRVCFGNHDWHVCPIVTRDFAGQQSAQSDAHQPPQRSPISLSPEEKQQAVLERLAQRIRHAAQSAVKAGEGSLPTGSGKPNAQLVVDAYTAFVSSPFRETFAELHAEDTNQLSLLLSRIQQYRRAAFVLCHIPLSKRSNEAYLKLVHFFNVTEEEALTLLQTKKESQGQGAAAAADTSTTTTTTAPNFVQVTKTCCMCLDQRHASHECPRLEEWLKGVQRLARGGGSAADAAKPTTALVDSAGEARLRQRLRAQVDGWTTAGPERLHAFYRYLQTHMSLLRPTTTSLQGATHTLTSSGTTLDASRTSSAAASAAETPRRVDFNDPLVYAVNKTVTKLAAVERRSAAYRLYAHAPVECVSMATTAAMLRMNGFAEDSIRALLKEGDVRDDGVSRGGEESASSSFATEEADLMTARSSSSVTALTAPGQHAPLAARTAAVPVHRCCLLCFSSGHTYVDCPELAAAATEAEKLRLVVEEVGGISCVHDGIGAAAAYVYHEYNRGKLSSELMRSNPALVAALLTLVRRCFATHQLSHGVRVLRRIPVEMTPPATAYADLWRAAGLPEDVVEQKQSQLLSLFDGEGLVPCVDPPPPRPTYSNQFLSQLSRTLHDGLCRHCYQHGHTIATCPLFHAEVSFGRDYVAAYRMSMMSEQLDRAWQEAYLLKLVDFFSTHYLFMPYHIAGVANALNAITAMWSFRGEPGIALRNLLLIPPAYRRRQAFKHVLHCLRVPSSDITRLLGDFYFAPDVIGGGGGGGGGSSAQQQQEVVMAQHLLIPKPAIRDVALRQIFEHVPAAMAALEESAERMAQIRASHERRGGGGGDAAKNIHGSTSGNGTVSEGSIAARIQQSLRAQQQQMEMNGEVSSSDKGSNASSSAAAASFHSPILRRVMQSGDMTQLREDFDPILAELEDAVGMRLGSRHTLFTSAMDILGAAVATAASSPSPSSSSSATPTSTAGAASSTPVRGEETKKPTTAKNASVTQDSLYNKGGVRGSAAVASPSRPTPEAEVVIEVQTETVQPSRPSATPSKSTRPNSRTSQQHGHRPPQQHRKAPAVAAGLHGTTNAREAKKLPTPPTSEDEILSSFPSSSAQPPVSQKPRAPPSTGGGSQRSRPYARGSNSSGGNNTTRGRDQRSSSSSRGNNNNNNNGRNSRRSYDNHNRNSDTNRQRTSQQPPTQNKSRDD